MELQKKGLVFKCKMEQNTFEPKDVSRKANQEELNLNEVGSDHIEQGNQNDKVHKLCFARNLLHRTKGENISKTIKVISSHRSATMFEK